MALRQLPRGLWTALFGLAIAGAGVLYAQIGGERGVAADDSGGSFEVGGIDVDVRGSDAEAARLAGWRLAQRKGWDMLAQRLKGSGSSLGDGALDSLVTGIVIENEELGPHRYVARLGVLFDRGRAASILGVGGTFSRSAPMLLVPLEISGGASTVFENRTPWQEAWARFRAGNSPVDYVRPSGTGPDPLIINAGQTGRRGRGWWRSVLDQYGASDVLIPAVQLYRQWPGGPVIGVFTARHGPDNAFLGKFVLRVASSGSIDKLLDAGVQRMDAIYQQALHSGLLKVDSGLIAPPQPVAEETPATDEVVANDGTPAAESGTVVSVQFDTPDAGAVSATEASLRSVSGVRSASTTSLALGGVSVMRVQVDGDVAALKAGLQARGWQVEEAGGTLRIRRQSAAPPVPVPSDTRPAG